MNPSKRESELDEENEAFLDDSEGSEHGATPSKALHNTRRGVTWYLRIIMEIAMAATIAYLLLFRPPTHPTLQRTPVPNLPRKITTFHTNPLYTNENMFFNETLTLHTLHNWIPLSSASRGYITIPGDHTHYDLPTPLTIALDRFTTGPGYMISVFHQLHCLSYLAEHFQQGYGGVQLTEKVAHHGAHCFEYLRQAIMCAADTTLEGETDAGPGEGSQHVCTDYEALLEWANEHAAYKWRNGLLPEESVL
jgi:hypothetical protein